MGSTTEGRLSVCTRLAADLDTVFDTGLAEEDVPSDAMDLKHGGEVSRID